MMPPLATHWSVNLGAMSLSNNLLCCPSTISPYYTPKNDGSGSRLLCNSSPTIMAAAENQESGSCGIVWSESDGWSPFSGVFSWPLVGRGSCHAFYNFKGISLRHWKENTDCLRIHWSSRTLHGKPKKLRFFRLVQNSWYLLISHFHGRSVEPPPPFSFYIFTYLRPSTP